jgi:phosphoglucosamine mutase
MFGTSGIRGIYGQDITGELASDVASIFADGRLIIARDLRESGIALLKGACAGAFSAGSDVIDLGIVPTPTAALASKKHASRAIMLTASHNPPEYNGLKLIERGKEIDKRMEKGIERAYKEIRKPGNAPVSQKGERSIFHDESIIDDHKALISGMVDSELIAKKKPKVLVDCNGAASVITPQLLTDLGCRVVSVNASRCCFNRPSEPNATNLAYLSGLVRSGGFDFAIAHDGDGDRCMVLDETGAALPLDAQLAMMIAHELEGSSNKRIISTVEASLMIRDVVGKAGGTIDITPVGSTFIGDLMEENGALFGGEPCGEYIYRDGVHVPDAELAAAKFVQMFCEKGVFSKRKYPAHFMARERFPAKDKQASMLLVRGSVAKLGIDGDIRADDGIRLDEEDGWFLIRASGTEPIIRLTMEYKTKARLEQRRAQMIKLIKDAAA